MKENFWPDAARGGVVLGLIAVGALALKVWMSLGMAASLMELIAVAYWIYFYTRRRSVQEGGMTYGRCMKFVLAMMMLAGVIYGVGYYLFVNHWAVDYFARQFETVWDMTGVAVDRGLFRSAIANPIYCVISGIMAEVFYGGVVGLFVVAFIRKR